MLSARHVRWLLTAGFVAFAHTVSAQVGADAARRALIIDARVRSRAGDHAGALELATRAEAIRATPSLRLFLAGEHMLLGHTVEAFVLAGECAARARDDATVPDRASLLARCEALARQAEPGVARLTVRVPSPAPEGLRVTVAGDALAPSLYDIAVPRMPGEVEVAASSARTTPFRTSRTLAAGSSEVVTVTLPPLEIADPPPVAPPLRVVPPVAPPVAPTPIARRPRAPSTPASGPWILAGAGLAAGLSAGVLAAFALDARAQRDAACPSASDCLVETATDQNQRYRDMTLGANLAVGVSIALAVGAVTWWLLDRGVHRPAVGRAYAPGGVVLRW